MTTPILHHYPESSFSEKIRALMGFKGLAWRSVTAPDVMPKPALTALTGGYRLVPVLQRGADIYCGSDISAMALEQIAPEPAPGPSGGHTLHEAFGLWGEAIFSPLVTIALARGAFSDAFVADRQVMSGPGFNPKSAARYEPWQVHRAHRQFGALDHHLADGRAFLAGDRPGPGDFAAYHPVWSLPALGLGEALNAYPHLSAWRDRMAALGHGNPTEITEQDALDQAASAEPAPLSGGLDHPFMGQPVKVRHDGYDGGTVEGTAEYLDDARIAIARHHETLGRLRVWFAVRTCVVTQAKPKGGPA